MKDAETREWIIQRCTQKGTFHPERAGGACWELEYEGFPTPESTMTYTDMLAVLDRVQRERLDSEFRGHRVNVAAEVAGGTQ